MRSERRHVSAAPMQVELVRPLVVPDECPACGSLRIVSNLVVLPSLSRYGLYDDVEAIYRAVDDTDSELGDPGSIGEALQAVSTAAECVTLSTITHSGLDATVDAYNALPKALSTEGFCRKLRMRHLMVLYKSARDALNIAYPQVLLNWRRHVILDRWRHDGNTRSSPEAPAELHDYKGSAVLAIPDVAGSRSV